MPSSRTPAQKAARREADRDRRMQARLQKEGLMAMPTPDTDPDEVPGEVPEEEPAALPDEESPEPDEVEMPASAQAHLAQLIAQLSAHDRSALAHLLTQAQPPETVPAVRPLAKRSAAPGGPMHWVRFTLPGIKTFTYHGKAYDLGQLITLAGGSRDEQLTRMEFVKVAPDDEAHLRAECGVCQQWFVNEYFRDRHGRERHRSRFQDADPLEVGAGMAGPEGGAALRDITGDADERQLMQDMPLRLDRTAATLNG